MTLKYVRYSWYTLYVRFQLDDVLLNTVTNRFLLRWREQEWNSTLQEAGNKGELRKLRYFLLLFSRELLVQNNLVYTTQKQKLINRFLFYMLLKIYKDYTNCLIKTFIMLIDKLI